ncbi:MAG TPA: glycosyltransferase [Anaerolineae bacterium]|nr:glycosyltransferase [Anaerolineae bacterium]
MPPVFSLIVPVYNGCSSLELLFRCLEAQSFPRDQFECLVVDDGSQDGTLDWLKQYRPGVNLRYFSHPVNQGRSQARNTACAQAEGTILVFLDADMLPEPGWLAEYHAAFETGDVDVVSGGRYHLNLGAKTEEPGGALARALQVPPEAVLVEDVSRHFERIRALAQLSMYPSLAMQRFEAQLPQACRAYPDSLLCAYALITSNVAVRRSTFERTSGFDLSMRRGEDTELGVRLWELGARFGFAPNARAYHLYHAGQGDRDNTWTERLAFFYRHPYLPAFLITLWFTYHDQPDPHPPSPMFDSLTALLAAKPAHPDFDLSAEFNRVYRQPLPAECIYDREFMADYFCEHSGIARDVVEAYLDQAVARGLVVQRRAGSICFDFNHTTNWLRKCTPYQQYEYERTRYGWLREWIPGASVNLQAELPGAASVGSRTPIELRVRGRYEIHIPPDALPGSTLEATLNIPLPIEHACQADVQLMNCEPPDLMDYAGGDRALIYQLPLRRGEDGAIRISYEFACTLREHISQERFGDAPSDGNLSRFLRPTYPPAQLVKAQDILKKIFRGPVDNSYAIACAIYAWVLNHTVYLQSHLNDYLILETRFGPCVHLARLFVNLCRLMRVPAREQCGALFGRASSPETPRRVEATGRVYNVLNHTWAEFYTPTHGWAPVDFTANDLGRRILSPVNVTDARLRAQIARETEVYDDYYFGNLDPFRLYTTAQANQLPTYPIVKSKIDPETFQRLITQTRHSLTCDFYPVDEQPPAAHFEPFGSSAPVVLRTREQRPLKAVLTSLGSIGDAQPFFALAHELRRHGHEPVIAMASYFEERARSQGFAFAPLAGATTEKDMLREFTARNVDLADPIDQVRHYLAMTLPALPQMFRSLRAVCEGADVLISAPFHQAARMVYDTTDVPFVTIHLSPFGSQGSKALREASAPIINTYRRQEGLPALDDPLGADGGSPQLALFAVSPVVFRPPAEWPAHYHITGYFFLDEENWQPDPALAEFVEAGNPPVVFAFGSVPCDDPEQLTDLVLAAIEQVGRRAVLQHGLIGLGRGRSLPEQVRAIGFVPHRWLFPRAACVVHHGGAGTTAATFRAGVPAVFVPWWLDQPIWGEYARALGCASEVIPIKELTAERLSSAIAKASAPRYRRMAEALGRRVRAEAGVRAARVLIEQVAAARRVSNRSKA